MAPPMRHEWVPKLGSVCWASVLRAGLWWVLDACCAAPSVGERWAGAAARVCACRAEGLADSRVGTHPEGHPDVVGVEQQCWPAGQPAEAMLMTLQMVLSPMLSATLPVESQAPVNRVVMRPGEVCCSDTVWVAGGTSSQPVLSPPVSGPATRLPSMRML